MWKDRLQQMPSILQLLVIFYQPLPFVFFATFPPQNKGIAILKKAQHSQYKPRKVTPTEHTAFIDLPEKEHLPTIHWHRTQAKRAWRTVLSRCRAVQLCWKWDTEAGVGLRGSPWSLEPPSTSQASTLAARWGIPRHLLHTSLSSLLPFIESCQPSQGWIFLLLPYSTHHVSKTFSRQQILNFFYTFLIRQGIQHVRSFKRPPLVQSSTKKVCSPRL